MTLSAIFVYHNLIAPRVTLTVSMDLLLICIFHMREINTNSATANLLPSPRPCQPKRINPKNRIRRIHIQIQRMRIDNRTIIGIRNNEERARPKNQH